MAARDFSSADVITALVNAVGYYVDHTTGSYVVLKWEPPADHDSDTRTVVVPAGKSRIRTGTLKNIMEQAGGEDFQAFCRSVERNS